MIFYFIEIHLCKFGCIDGEDENFLSSPHKCKKSMKMKGIMNGVFMTGNGIRRSQVNMHFILSSILI